MGFFSAITGGISKLFGGGDSGSSGVEHAIDTTMDIGKTWLGYNMAKHQFKDQMSLARDQFQFQKDLAKKQMQWRVEDAKAAGLHPLAVLGLSPSSFSPVSAGSPTAALDTSSLSGLGQNIDRAIMAGKNSQERQEAIGYLKADAELTLRNKQLNNELVETELADKRFRLQQQMFPPAPTVNSATGLIPGVDSPRLVSPEPMRTTPHLETGKEPGSNPSVGWLQNPDGTFSPVMSDEAKNRLEDDFVGELLWSGRNRVMPHLRWVTGLGDNKISEPPRSLLPKGAKGWRYTGWGSYAPIFD